MTLPDGQCQHGGGSDFSKVYVAGGYDASYAYTTTIQVYDRLLDEWNLDPLFLTEERGKVACAVADGKMLCGGGINFNTLVESATVEIQDLATASLEGTAALSAPRVELSAVGVGSKILFAGGMDFEDGAPLIGTPSSVVDIYDVGSGTWSTATLSEARGGMASAVLGTKAYFAGGYKGNGAVSDRVDIYDASTNTWTQATLSAARAFYGGGTAAGTKVFFAGGQLADETATTLVDVYDTTTDTWSTADLSAARYGIQATSVGNYALFAGGGPSGFLTDWYYTAASAVVDIHDAGADAWSSTTMSYARVNFLATTSGNQAFFVGGYDFVTDMPETVDVFTDASQNAVAESTTIPELRAWPVPCTGHLTVGHLATLNGCRVELMDGQGALAATWLHHRGTDLDLSAVPDGLYLVRLFTDDGTQVLAQGSVVKVH